MYAVCWLQTPTNSPEMMYIPPLHRFAIPQQFEYTLICSRTAFLFDEKCVEKYPLSTLAC